MPYHQVEIVGFSGSAKNRRPSDSSVGLSPTRSVSDLHEPRSSRR